MAILETNFLVEVNGETGKIPNFVSGINSENFKLISTTIQFFLDSVFISEFIFKKDFTVFLEPRPNPVVGASFSSFKDTINDLNQWIAFVDSFVKLPSFPQTGFEEEIEKDNNELKFKFTLNDDLLLDATWHINEDTLDFGSRVTVTISWADFLNYVDSLNKLLFVEIPNARR